jgi:hypothetical protein
MITFQDVKQISDKYGEGNDCTVKAVAIACQIPYEEAHQYLSKLGRRKGRGWYHATHIRGNKLVRGYIDNLEKIGIEYVPVDFNSRTVSQLGREFCRGNYIVQVSGHALALVDGKVEDWTAGRKHHVKQVWRIENPRVHKVDDVVISPVAPKGFRKLRHKKAARLGLDPKTGLPLA